MQERNLTMKKVYTINDIKGYPEARKKLIEIADSFQRHDEYIKNSLDVPKGVFLSGAPGTGKTLFAKVLAHESKASFYEFKATTGELFSGSLALKRFVWRAKKHTPSIIFIDEVDKYLDNPRFTATLLTLLDGFDGSSGIMFVLATNNDYGIPEALLRSGRMDEHIQFSLPDKAERKEIISYYLEKIPFNKKVDAAVLAGKTNGFTGADICNLIAMTARKAFANHIATLTDFDFYEPIHNIYFHDIRKEGIQHKSHAVAVHEIGHQLVAKLLCNIDSDSSIDIYSQSLGSTIYNDFHELIEADDEDDDDYDYDEDSFHEESKVKKKAARFQGKEFFEGVISSMLGGRAAETMFFSAISLGSGDDVDHAKEMALSMLNSGLYGYEFLNYDDEYYLGGEGNAKKRQDKVNEILTSAEQRAIELIAAHKSSFENAVKKLEERTILTSEEFASVLRSEKKGKTSS